MHINTTLAKIGLLSRRKLPSAEPFTLLTLMNWTNVLQPLFPAQRNFKITWVVDIIGRLNDYCLKVAEL